MTAAPRKPVAAAIDIGSNSIKMTVARPDGLGGIEQIDWASEVVRLGQGLDETGRLHDRRIHLAVETLSRFAARARDLGAGQIVAVATEATRSASNGAVFLQRARDEAGIDVRAVSGLEEAALMFRGISATTDVSGQIVVADIGGGSTEIIVASDGQVLEARSLPLGSGRLTERLIHADPPTPAELLACEAAARQVVSAVAAMIPPAGSERRLVIVGGTGEFMVRLLPGEAPFDQSAVRSMLGKLAVLTAAELADAIDVAEARARVLPAGVAIVAAIASLVQPASIEAAQSGLRAGLLLEAFESMSASTGPADAGERLVEDNPQLVADDGEVDPADDDFQAVMARVIAERWEAVWRAIPEAIQGTSSEGVHDVRVASRRLRAAMDVAEPLFPRKWFRPLRKTAREITGALGAVRDRDVLLEALQIEIDQAPLAEKPGIARLIHRLEMERAEARIEMERFLHDLLASEVPRVVAHRFGVPLPAELTKPQSPAGSA